jgi:hypothetical protein
MVSPRQASPLTAMLRTFISWLSAGASVFGLLFTLWHREGRLTAAQGATVGVLGLIFLGAACYDIWYDLKRQPKQYRERRKVIEYMSRWISRGGRVVVFTRDHTWANEPKIQELLFTKARLNELTICLPSDTELTQKLRISGAEIITYSKLGYDSPGSRFTIVNDGQSASASVAIGKTVDGVHVIEEFPSGDPVFAVTKDLVEILRRIKE